MQAKLIYRGYCIILELATDLTDSPDGSVILFDDQRECLYFADAIGASAEMLLRQFGATGGEGIPTVRVAAAVAQRRYRAPLS